MLTGLTVAQFFPQSPIIVTGGNPQNGKTEAGQMRNMLQLLGFPSRSHHCGGHSQQHGTERSVLGAVGEASRHVGHHPGDVHDASGACRWGLRRCRRQSSGDGELPDGNPSVNVVQFARDAISPFVNVG